MKTQQLKAVILKSLLACFSIILLTNCEKTPTAVFSYSPSTNVEAGDSVMFVNESLDALSFEWDFGDGTTSSDENPVKVYSATGSVNVTMTATNETKSADASQAIVINDPTVFGLIVYEMEGETVTDNVIPNCSVWLYDNETDWLAYENPIAIATTDSDGIVLFPNVELQIYYFDCLKEVSSTNYWFGYGGADITVQNDLNGYYVGCTYETYSEGKNIKKSLDQSFVNTSSEPASLK